MPPRARRRSSRYRPSRTRPDSVGAASWAVSIRVLILRTAVPYLLEARPQGEDVCDVLLGLGQQAVASDRPQALVVAGERAVCVPRRVEQVTEQRHARL